MTTIETNNTPTGGAVLDAITANTHTFDTPIVRGEQTITHVTLAKPSAGALRGTSLAALVNLDVDALRKVLPRISTPTLTTAPFHELKRRRKAKRKSVIVGGENNKNVKVLPEDYATEAEARAAAQAEFKRMQRSQATMRYSLARGRADLFPEMPVTLSGFKPEIDETAWLVKKATHTIDSDGGFMTGLDLEMRDDPTTERHRSHFKRGK